MKLKDIVKEIMRESLHVLSEKNTEGLSVIDKWKITDHDFLQDMGFKPNGMYHFVMDKPEMSVCHKKGVGFILDDKSKKQKLMFPKFKQLMEYFSTYQQKFENEPYRDEEEIDSEENRYHQKYDAEPNTRSGLSHTHAHDGEI